MRTTVEMNDRLRAELLRLAAQKGEKGFSNIVQEAVAAYIVTSTKTKDLQQKARKLKGSLKETDAKSLKEETLKIRDSWR
jgi:metal-responsive CopG/Arc/MetJ family transcriptional regulator